MDTNALNFGTVLLVFKNYEYFSTPISWQAKRMAKHVVTQEWMLRLGCVGASFGEIGEAQTVVENLNENVPDHPL